jgi:hypothetical protein
MTKKRFDAIKMKREGSDRIRQAIEGMALEEELAYWRRGTAELLEEQKARRRSDPSPPPDRDAE